jgi:DNA-binding HxlR family transcriptional regulator
MTMKNTQFSEVNAKSNSQLSQQADELLEVVHQFCLWEEENESLVALPQLEEHEESGDQPASETARSL